MPSTTRSKISFALSTTRSKSAFALSTTRSKSTFAPTTKWNRIEENHEDPQYERLPWVPEPFVPEPFRLPDFETDTARSNADVTHSRRDAPPSRI